MKEFKRKIPIEKAASYRLEYMCYLRDEKQFEYRDFKSLKSLNQWEARNTDEFTIGILSLRKLALLGDEWVPFTTIGKKNITLNELLIIVEDLKYSKCEN